MFYIQIQTPTEAAKIVDEASTIEAAEALLESYEQGDTVGLVIENGMAENFSPELVSDYRASK